MKTNMAFLSGLRRFVLAGTAAALTSLFSADLKAVQYTDFVSFSLSPGETGLSLALDQFSLSSYTLNSVTIALNATFSADVTLFGLSSSDVTYAWSLGSASPASPAAVVTSSTAGLITPGSVSALLSGSQLVPANGSVAFSASQSGSSSVVTTDSSKLTLYRGSGTVEYVIDVTALYPEMITTTPDSANAIFANARMTGTLTVTYDATPPPTAVPPARDFVVQWMSPDHAVLQWWALSNSGYVGLFLERRIDDGEWTRLGDGMFSLPVAGGPQHVRFDDQSLPAHSQVMYRLVGVKNDGTTEGAQEASVSAGLTVSIEQTDFVSQLRASGRPGTQVTVESADQVDSLHWTRVGILVLDDQGTATLGLSSPQGERAKFYRLLAE